MVSVLAAYICCNYAIRKGNQFLTLLPTTLLYETINKNIYYAKLVQEKIWSKEFLRSLFKNNLTLIFSENYFLVFTTLLLYGSNL